MNEDCLPKTIAGVYEAGTPLGASNFITVDVNVTGVGTYTITTDTVNGYYFRGTGTFGSTGVQTIKLTGIGKPVDVGTDDFLVSYKGTSCFISITVLPDGSAGPAVFSLQGAGGSCTNATLAGNYILLLLSMLPISNAFCNGNYYWYVFGYYEYFKRNQFSGSGVFLLLVRRLLY